MAYKITYKFGKALDVGDSIRGNHLIRMAIEFTVEDTAADEEHFAGDYGIKVADWGELDWSRALEDNLMIPGNFEFQLFDKDETLKDLLFEGTLVPYVRKDGKVTLEIKYSGDANYTTEYVGYIDNTSIEYDVVNKMISLSCYPKTDLLKNFYLYDDANDGSGTKIGNNPLDVNYTVSGDVYTATAMLVQTLIHNIFKKINPTCTLAWQHNWLFKGEAIATPVNLYDEFTLDQIYFKGPYLSALFFSIENPYSIETVYDLLMKYAFAFGFVCGMITSEKAFVKELFNYDSGNTQTLGKVRKHIISNRAGDIEAVRVAMRMYDRVGPTKKNAYRESASSFAIIPTGGQIRGDAIIDEEIPVYGKFIILLGALGDMYYPALTGELYTIYNAQPPKMSTFWSLDETIALFYYNLRNRHKLNLFAGTLNPAGIETSIGRVDTFIVDGLKYDYMKDFSYNSNGYQILSMKKRLNDNITEFDALLVADGMDEGTPDGGTPPPKPFQSVLPGGYLKEYSFNAKVLAADANTSPVTLMNIEAGFRLTVVNMYFVTGFNNVTSFQLEDNDGVIEYSDTIIWNQANNLITIPVYKDYPAQATLKAVITNSGTITTGEVDIELKLQTRL